MIRWVVAFLLCAGAARAERPSPKPAPRVFTTNNYELTARIPPGLWRCPYPEDWVGPDHGVVMYFYSPKDCSAGGPEAEIPPSDSLPRITIGYQHSLGEVEARDGTVRPLRTNSEIPPRGCPVIPRLISSPLLLGARPVSCETRKGRWVSRMLTTLYDEDPHAGTPSFEAFVILDTTVDRLARDMAAFRAVAAGLRVCDAPTWPSQPARPKCPPIEQW